MDTAVKALWKDTLDIVGGRAGLVSFESFYRNSYNLTVFGRGSDVQILIRRSVCVAVRLCSPTMQHFVMEMLRDIHMFHQQTYCRKNNLPTIAEVMQEERERLGAKRMARAIAITDKYKRAWQKHYWEPDGGFVNKTKLIWCTDAYRTNKNGKRSQPEKPYNDEPSATARRVL